MNSVNYFLLLAITALFLGCDDATIEPWKFKDLNRSLEVTTIGLPNEPGGCTCRYKRRIIFFKSLNDMQMGINKIAEIDTEPGFNGMTRTVELSNVNYDSIYIRIQSLEGNYGRFFIRGRYYIDKPIVIAPHNGLTSFIAYQNLLISE